MTRCVQCGNPKPKRGTVVQELDAAGVQFAASVPALVCGRCGESYVEAKDLSRLELTAARWLADMGQRRPDVFRFMRKALGFRGVDLAALLDVTPETISRWENGALPVERRAFALLGDLVAERLEGREATMARLRALREPPELPRRGRVRLDVA